MDINLVILSGRVVRIFDLKYWPDGTPWMALSLVTTRRLGHDTHSQFHRVVLVGRFTESVQMELDTQQEIRLTGELTHRKAGETWITEVRVDSPSNLEMGQKRRRPSDNAAGSGAEQTVEA